MYNIIVLLILLIFINFYFFNKNGKKLINFYEEKVLKLKNKKLYFKNEKFKKIEKIFFWKNYDFVRESFARNNLDLIMNDEFCIYI